MDNKHIQSIQPKIPVPAQQRIDEANALLAPYFLPLTSRERLELPKMGDKSLSFVEKAHDYVRHYLAFVPSCLNNTGYDFAGNIAVKMS
jgi:hypothetical protein